MASNTERIIELEKTIRRQIDLLAVMSIQVQKMVTEMKGNDGATRKAMTALEKLLKGLVADVDALELGSPDDVLERRIAAIEKAVRSLPSPAGRERPVKPPNANLVAAMKATMKRRAAKEKAAAAAAAEE